MAVRIADTLGTMGEGGYPLVKAIDVQMSDGKTVQVAIEEAEAIAKGKSAGYVFDTEADLDTWLADADNVAKLKLGDNLYIRAVDVPDYWWDGTSKQRLETQKVDLTNYYTKNEVYAKTETYTRSEIEQKIAEGGGGTSVGGDSYINVERYEETELVIGEYCGKPLYRRILAFEGISSQDATYSISEKVPNIDVVVKYSCFSNNQYLPAYSQQYPAYSIGCWIDTATADKKLRINTGSGTTSPNVKVILDYTKSTDAEGSFRPAMVTNQVLVSAVPYCDYSEDEVCVGKWIDGKPVYRKVINTVMLKTSAQGTSKNTNVDTMITALDKCVGLSAYFINATGSFIFTPWVSGNNRVAFVQNSGGSITIFNSIYTEDFPCTIILEYTKTTDAENSFVPSMVTGGIVSDEVTESDIDEVLDLLGGND